MSINQDSSYPGGSRKRVNRAGENLRNGKETREDIKVLEDWRTAHGHVLNTFQSILGDRTKGTNIVVAQRHKRKRTIIDKLKRHPEMKLARMDDVAGCRLIFESVDDLYEFRSKIHQARLNHDLKNDVARYDYIKFPKKSGYRGVHDVYSYNVNSPHGSKYNGLLIEIQYRTLMQHAWATAVEVVGLITDSEPKFKRGDDRFLKIFRFASEIMSRAFENRNSCLSNFSNREIVEGFDKLDSELNLIQMLSDLSVTDKEILKQRPLILIFEDDELDVKPFWTIPEAFEVLFELEKENHPYRDIVLVKALESSYVRLAFKNYFSDAKDFVKKIKEGRRKLTKKSLKMPLRKKTMKKLFYSYAHEDKSFRDKIIKHLAILIEKNSLGQLNDRKILPSGKLNDEIKAEMLSSDIILLLLSSNFLASTYCMEEMKEALRLRKEKGVAVIPILLSSCSWKDVKELSKLMVLPKDGRPIADWSSQEEAFLNIYESIKLVIKKMEFSVKEEFESKLNKIAFISQSRENLKFDDIFVFPNIVHLKEWEGVQIKNFDELWDVGNHLVLRGEETSGKTTICRKIFIECLVKNAPVVMISGQEIRSPRNHDVLIKKKFNEQFHGNYKRWKECENKTLVIDDLDSHSRLEFLDFAKKHFNRIFITTSEDAYLSYFRNEEKLADYEILSLKYFTHIHQQNLIERWKNLHDSGGKSEKSSHGEIDRIEDDLNSIILNNRIVPRYPFFILSILQTYERFMPQNLRITAYGHCYQALITAQLLKCGTQRDDIDSAFNFLTHFAFDIFSNEKHYSKASFNSFVQKYREQFVISETIINRLKRGGVVVVDPDGNYQLSYSFVYYFFLGNFFARNYEKHKDTLEQIAEKSYLRDNRYILIFTIHHAHDDALIDTILLHTMIAMEHRSVAKLTAEETKPLLSALTEIPHKIISRRSVEEERKSERELREKIDATESVPYEEEYEDKETDSLYKSLKNMEILGQILKNKYGSLSKDKLQQIVTTIANAGLRIVTLFTDDKGMQEFEDYLVKRFKEANSSKDANKTEDRLKKLIRAYCFFLIAMLIGKIVTSIRKPELAEVMTDVRRKEDTPAYDLIDYFFGLGTAKTLRKKDVDKMSKLIKKLDKQQNEVARRLLSIMTQDYLNKHNVKYELRRRTYRELRVGYRPNTEPKPKRRK